MGLPRLWDLIQSFKRECESQGWKTSQTEDLVTEENQYHNFLWTRTIHPSTFEKIAHASKCAVREGVNYHVVDVAYTAWLLSEPPSEELWKTVMNDPILSDKIAIYDLSKLSSSEPICPRLNSTKSKVFTEFENFLKKRFGAVFKTPRNLLTAQV
jgi:hypothetical protein